MFKIKGIDPTIKVLATPVLVIIGSLLLAAFIIWNGYPKVMAGLQNINESKKDKNSLEERLSVLQDFSKGALSNQSNVVFIVLPDKNPGAALVSQIKILTANNNLFINEVSSLQTNDFQSDIVSITLDYKLLANDMRSAISFLKDLESVAPILTTKTVDITRVDEGIQVNLSIDLYWSDLPTKLPEITEPLTELSAKDRETLNIIQSYKMPQFVNLSPRARNEERENPFN
jgi:hypothetical protein